MTVIIRFRRGFITTMLFVDMVWRLHFSHSPPRDTTPNMLPIMIVNLGACKFNKIEEIANIGSPL
jgi:hypothetical protein